ncbi:MAG: hypothetical protein L6R41_006173 [Letrouitia leprolyta]|nr:MAG: hypothetical protein L6R41_006173 [Letrouitia leprolyta]
MSIGQYMVENPPTQHVESQDTSLQSCAGGLRTVDVLKSQSFGFCALTPRAIVARYIAFEPAGRPRTTVFTKFFGRTYSASIAYDDTRGGFFTILVLGAICADSIIGDFEKPQIGIVEHKVKLSSIYQSLVALDLDAPYNYTITMLHKSIATLKTALQRGICGGDKRPLLPRLQPTTPQDSSRWTFTVLPLALGFGIGLPADPVAITHLGPFAHISPVG